MHHSTIAVKPADTMKHLVHAAWLPLLLLILPVSASAQRQHRPLQGIRMTRPHAVQRQGDTAVVDLQLDLTDMPPLSSYTALQVTPVLCANDSSARVGLPPIVISGGTRAVLLRRNGRQADIVRARRGPQMQRYTARIPFALWMKDASLLLVAQASGCAECDLGSSSETLTHSALAPLYKPRYRYASMTPPGEKVKRRQEQMTVRIAFPLGKTELHPELGNNRAELQRIETKLRELTTDRTLTVEDLSLTGYASPEGSSRLNDRLSQGRVDRIARHLVRLYPLFEGHYASQAAGADWDGLREAVEKSDIEHREQVLDILRTTPPDERAAALRSIDSGQTYARMLQTCYPPLRRTVITCSFVVRDFDPVQAAEVFRTHPERLSLAEAALLADSYPAGSRQRYETWVRAAETWPMAVEPANNAAVMDIEAGRCEQAVRLLERFEANTALYNILGVAYACSGDHEKARACLTRAAQLGLPDAQYNLGECIRYIEDNF